MDAHYTLSHNAARLDTGDKNVRIVHARSRMNSAQSENFTPLSVFVSLRLMLLKDK